MAPQPCLCGGLQGTPLNGAQAALGGLAIILQTRHTFNKEMRTRCWLLLRITLVIRDKDHCLQFATGSYDKLVNRQLREQLEMMSIAVEHMDTQAWLHLPCMHAEVVVQWSSQHHWCVRKQPSARKADAWRDQHMLFMLTTISLFMKRVQACC